MSVKVKICGVRNLEAAETAVNSGADFLGFNFVPTSKRYIDPKIAKKIIKTVKGKAKIVGVFQNDEIVHVNDVASNLGLDFIQLHGMEDNEYIESVKVQVIKSITLDDDLQKVSADYLMLDRVDRGEGELVDPDKARVIAGEHQIFLAGGLNPENVSEAVLKVSPFAVDVAGGIETNGVQDLEKIKRFIKNARLASRAKRAKGAL